MILSVEYKDINKKYVKFKSINGDILIAYINKCNIQSIKRLYGKNLLHTRIKQLTGINKAEFLEAIAAYENK